MAAPSGPVGLTDPPVARSRPAPETDTAAAGRAVASLRHVRLALGCFALVLAVLLPTVVYPRLATLPADPRQTQLQRDRDATVLVVDTTRPAGARVVEGADVTVSTFVSRAPVDAPDGVVVWDLGTRVTAEGHGLVNARVERVSLDARTAEPVNCCGDRLVTEDADPDGRPVEHRGYITFPFGVEPRDQLIWDVQIGRARLARYYGEETRDGVRTYRFVAQTPLEQIGTRKLPGALFGRPAPSVNAAEQYADTRTYWVEPATGAVVGLEEKLRQQFSYRGKVVPAVSADLVSPSLEPDLLEQVRQGAVVLPWLRWRASAVLTVTGVVLLLLGAYRPRGSGREPASRSTSRSASRWASDMRPAP